VYTLKNNRKQAFLQGKTKKIAIAFYTGGFVRCFINPGHCSNFKRIRGKTFAPLNIEQ